MNKRKVFGILLLAFAAFTLGLCWEELKREIEYQYELYQMNRELDEKDRLYATPSDPMSIFPRSEYVETHEDETYHLDENGDDDSYEREGGYVMTLEESTMVFDDEEEEKGEEEEDKEGEETESEVNPLTEEEYFMERWAKYKTLEQSIVDNDTTAIPAKDIPIDDVIKGFTPQGYYPRKAFKTKDLNGDGIEDFVVYFRQNGSDEMVKEIIKSRTTEDTTKNFFEGVDNDGMQILLSKGKNHFINALTKYECLTREDLHLGEKYNYVHTPVHIYILDGDKLQLRQENKYFIFRITFRFIPNESLQSGWFNLMGFLVEHKNSGVPWGKFINFKDQMGGCTCNDETQWERINVDTEINLKDIDLIDNSFATSGYNQLTSKLR
ncbi:MAG: hypothetical protein MJZ28_11260 [Paludibacteraceae bacterium]|nr:hypothetical protein [Paludibacteraceae bacterium]